MKTICTLVLSYYLVASMHSAKFSSPPLDINNNMDRNVQEICPWVGVLKVQKGNTEALARLILIGIRKAIGNAIEISTLDKVTLRSSSKAIFFENNVPWYSNISDYLLHPEFHNKTFNTIAILDLSCERKKWFTIQLPITKYYETSVYAIGIIDNSRKLEQSMFRMSPIDEITCKDFYTNEGLDFKNYWPEHLLCYKAADMQRSCVFDSGMALAIKLQGNWTLIGLGILGPGCGLPSRYINLLPYVPWLNLHMDKTKNERRHYRPLQYRSKTAIDPSKKIVSDSVRNRDDFHVHLLNDSTMVLRPAKVGAAPVHGNCAAHEGTVMYRDWAVLKALGTTGIGTYVLSIYDFHFNKITCVTLTVKCKARSITKFWFQKGFGRDDLSQFIKIVPHPKRVIGEDAVPPKILYLTDYLHDYDKITTANIVFFFEFKNEATIDVDFFGTPVQFEERGLDKIKGGLYPRIGSY